MGAFRSFGRILDRHTLAVTAASLLATFICTRVGLAAELPDGVIAIAVVFPLGFAISAAFGRREKALESYAAMKAYAAALYFAHRDWADGQGGNPEEVRGITLEVFESINRFLNGTGRNNDLLGEIYAGFSRLSVCGKRLKAAGVTSSEVARAYEYTHGIISQFERIRNIRGYRTPASLRAFGKIFLNVLPILFAPHFAYLAAAQSPAIGYIVAVVYSLMLVSLDNIQDALEDPFDAHGEDDIVLDSVEDYKRLTALHA